MSFNVRPSPPGHSRFLFAAVAALCVAVPGSAGAEIYRYKDKDGSWVFTDTPRGDLPGGEVPAEAPPRQQLPFDGDLARMLGQEFPPKNEIERAALAAVTIETPMGTGSGFFITADCYLLTNRHVVRSDEVVQQASKKIAAVDTAMQQTEDEFDREEAQVRKLKSALEDYRRRADAMTDRYARERSRFDYEQKRGAIEAYEERLAEKRRQFEEGKRKYDDAKYTFNDVTRRTDRAGTCTVKLKDQKTVEARLVTVSPDLDLALLKIDGCRSPYLAAADQSAIRQGMPVYAIGSPVGIADTVSAGVVSGYDSVYVRTDAKIYTGNSGGPLVTPEGRVVGINTLKEYTRNYEGLGYAIPIWKALQEFNEYLRPR